MYRYTISRRFLHYSASNAKDYYKILGISRNAKDSEIKKAYYQLAKKYHPDVNKDKGASEKFQELSEAYEVIGDTKRRHEYDQFGSSSASSQGRPSGPTGTGQGDFGWEFRSGRTAEQIFRDIFRDFDPFKSERGGFGETAEGFEAAQQVSVNISFEEAARGVRKEIKMNVVDACGACIGTGVQPGFKKLSCPYCNGTGMISQHVQGFFMQSTCSKCGGSGAFNKNPCLECKGHGQNVQSKSFNIEIPAGIDNGQTLRTQLGKSIIYVTISVAPSQRHRRDRENIFTDIEISLAQAVLGGMVEIPGIYNNTKVRIPSGTSSHAQMVLKGRGIKRLNQPGNGDQILNIKISVPKAITTEQREAILKYAISEKNRKGTVDGLDGPYNEEAPSGTNEKEKGGFRWSKIF